MKQVDSTYTFHSLFSHLFWKKSANENMYLVYVDIFEK